MDIYLKSVGACSDKSSHLDRILHRFDAAKIVKSVLEQAARNDQDVTLSVLNGNPAKALYEKLGLKWCPKAILNIPSVISLTKNAVA